MEIFLSVGISVVVTLLIGLIWFYTFQNKRNVTVTIDKYDLGTPDFLATYCKNSNKRLKRLNKDQYRIYDMSLYDMFYLSRRYVDFSQPEKKSNLEQDDGLRYDIALVSK
jgi:hypothetical protein